METWKLPNKSSKRELSHRTAAEGPEMVYEFVTADVVDLSETGATEARGSGVKNVFRARPLDKVSNAW